MRHLLRTVMRFASGSRVARLCAATLLIMPGVTSPAFSAQPAVIPAYLREAMERISIDSLSLHLNYLGSDDLAGRATGTPGAASAAVYLADQMKKMGLRPAGEHNTFFQNIPLHGSMPLSSSQLELAFDHSSAALTLFRDYTLYDTGSQTIIPQPLPLVFVGYGIVAPEYDYNDYQHARVKDAVVVFLSGEPYSADPDYFEGYYPTIYALPEMKHRIALAHGARGSVIIPSIREHGDRSWDEWQRMFSFEHVTSLYEEPGNFTILLNPARASLLFESSAFALEDVFDMDMDQRMRSFPLKTRIRFIGHFSERDFLSSNVLGLLEGSDPMLRDSYLLLSAHYDHLGVGPAVAGDSIYNGVVDNALGCAGLLEIARTLASGPDPARSVVFLFVTGEEKGLLGSRHYCAHPTIPLYKTIAAINIDGLAIQDTFDDIVAVGMEWSTMDRHTRHTAEALELSISSIPVMFRATDPFARSDQIAFAQAGIPSMLIMEGVQWRHKSREQGLQEFIDWGRTRYHTPFDDLSQPIDYDAVRQHIQIVLALAGTLADTFTPPQWLPGAPYIHARLQSMAEKR